MNASNAAQFLPLVQALADGKTLQMRHPMGDVWDDRTEVSFSYNSDFYRVKPEPREFRLWVDENGATAVPLNAADKLPHRSIGVGWREIRVREIL